MIVYYKQVQLNIEEEELLLLEMIKSIVLNQIKYKKQWKYLVWYFINN